MSAISGTRRAIKELADGTVRVQVDVDPQHRLDFFRLFPNIDMPVALAPLVLDHEREEPKQDAPKGGDLAKLAGIFCATPEFQLWLLEGGQIEDSTEDAAADWIRKTCGITSRAELDHDHGAAVLFHNMIRKPWLAHQGKA